MSQTSNQTCLTGAAPKTPSPVNLKRFAGWVVVALFMTLSPAPAQEPDDLYLRVYNLIQQADALNTSGQAGPALAKYRAAQTALQSLKRDSPHWNPALVSFRFNYLAEKVAALSATVSTPAVGGPAPATQPAPPETKAATTAATPQLKLLEAGAEPRKVLRLHPKPGDKQTLGITLKMAMDIQAGEAQRQAMQMPAMKMTMDVTVRSVSADGDITYEMVIGDASVSDEPGVLPQLAEALKSAFAGLKGLSGTGTTSDRGFSKGTELKVPPGANPQLQQVMEQMKESIATAAAPLPEEAVGPGARWEVRMPLKSQGMTIEQTVTYQLVSIEGERLTAKSTIAQRASNQKIENPAMPGLKLDLTKMVGNGTSDVTLDLAQLLPPARTVGFHSEASLAMDVGGQKNTMTVKQDVNARLEAK
ncbi:MAG: DUF6263 family protein [Verrucomicrobiota bacterium]|jgi:hypothetical protein